MEDHVSVVCLTIKTIPRTNNSCHKATWNVHPFDLEGCMF